MYTPGSLVSKYNLKCSYMYLSLFLIEEMSVFNMAWIASVASITASFFVTPFLMFMLCIIFLASIGKSLGVRRLFVKILLMTFEVSFYITTCFSFIFRLWHFIWHLLRTFGSIFLVLTCIYIVYLLYHSHILLSCLF